MPILPARPLSASNGLDDSRANNFSGAGIGSATSSDEVTAGPVIFSPDGSVVVDLRLTPCVVLMLASPKMVDGNGLDTRRKQSSACPDPDRTPPRPWGDVSSHSVGYGRIGERKLRIPIGAGSVARIARRWAQTTVRCRSAPESRWREKCGRLVWRHENGWSLEPETAVGPRADAIRAGHDASPPGCCACNRTVRPSARPGQ